MLTKPCAEPGCRVLIEPGNTYCTRHAIADKRLRERRADLGRADRPSRKWYRLAAWRARRLAQLRKEPLCAMCPSWSRQPANVADHVVPHRDDHGAFWFGELQSLCKACHDGKKQRMERRAEAGGEVKLWNPPTADRRG